MGIDRRKTLVAVCSALITFLAYSSVYAYRKPFTAATFGGLQFWGISYQTLLIISQVFGYMGSKFYGIKFIAELKRFGRWKTMLILISIAWLALLAFALVPAPYGMLFFFINGFMLGFFWGIIFSYIEGRRTTDFIGAVMAISFIFAGGFTRSVARCLIVECGVAETWMPFITGLIFIIPLLFFVYLLEKIPPPGEDDLRDRTIRFPMSKESRRNFLKQFSFGIVMVVTTYLFLTIMRDIRDNYMANIWNELGYGKNYLVFTQTETTNSVIILFIMSLLVLVRKNMRALQIVHWIIGAGILLAGISSWLFVNKMISGALWMQLVGLGLYMGYIPFNCIFFERLIAAFRITGNVGFLMYLADAFGYLGSVAVMLAKEFLSLHIQWSQFYSYGVIFGSILGVVATFFSYFYFNKKYLLQHKSML